MKRESVTGIEDEEVNRKVIAISVSIASARPTLKAAGYRVLDRYLISKPDNWRKISRLLLDLDPTSEFALVKLTEYTLFLASLPIYESALDSLIHSLSRLNHMVYVYTDNLDGKFSSEEEWKSPSSTRIGGFHQGGFVSFDQGGFAIGLEHFVPTNYVSENRGEFTPAQSEQVQVEEAQPIPKKGKRRTLLKSWCERYAVANSELAAEKMVSVLKQLQSQLTVVPYRTLTDVELSAASFVDAQIKGLLLRVYVPTERMWSGEVEKIVRLFQDYASNVKNLDVQLIQEHTENGTVYSLYSKSTQPSASSVPVLFEEFSMFLDICARNPERAGELLKDAKLSPSKSSAILTKYSKEAKRLALDIRQEAERKLLNIRHQLEAELNDVSAAEQISKVIGKQLQSDFSSTSPLMGPTIHTGTTIINNQYIDTVKGVVASQIYGRLNYSETDEQLLDVITKFASTKLEASELESALGELKDAKSDSQGRVIAWQRLKGFLSFAADKIGDVGVALLSKYLESYLGR